MEAIPQYIEKGHGTFRGTFLKYDIATGRKLNPEKVVVLENILDKWDNVILRQSRFFYSDGFKDLDLQVGAVVQFDANSKRYYNITRKNGIDVYVPLENGYKLATPTNIIVLKEEKL